MLWLRPRLERSNPSPQDFILHIAARIIDTKPQHKRMSDIYLDISFEYLSLRSSVNDVIKNGKIDDS